MGGPREQADRDATTVEIVFALVTGVVLAGLAMPALAVPVLLDRAHGQARSAWLTAGFITAGGIFVLRVGSVLRGYGKRRSCGPRGTGP